MHTAFPLTTVNATTTPYDRAGGASSAQQDERLLVEYAETGNREAFEKLVRLYEREIYGYLHHCLGDAQLAEDAFQATFLIVHLKCRQFEPGRRFRPWLYAIASNQAVDLMRRNRRHKALSLSFAVSDAGEDNGGQPLGNLLETQEIEPLESLILTEERDIARLALQSLPARVRQILVMLVYQGLRYREVSEALGIPLGTVKSRVNRALRDLRAALITVAKGQQPDLEWKPAIAVGCRTGVLDRHVANL
jgi:RNA polymerase sigma-70 factor, ECF subfamily